MLTPGLVLISFRTLDPDTIVRIAASAGLEAVEWGGDVHVPPGDGSAARMVARTARGAGVRLQRYKDGGLSDLTTFGGKEGLTWFDSAGRAFSMSLKELKDWRGNRADAGRLAPKGFPKSNKFGKTIAS
jgi:hypothetical protein